MLRFLPFAQEHVQHIKLMFDLSEDGRKALVEHKDIRGYTLFEEDVVLGIGSMVGATLSKLVNFDFLDNKSKLDKELEGTQGKGQKTQTELVQSANLFSDPENF